MRGRRPKTTQIKVISGNPGKRALNTLEPRPAAAMPTCPAHLNPSAKAEWKRLARELHDIGILSNLDRATLAGYCQAYGRWVKAEKKLKETPAILKMPSGYLQQNPWLTIANRQLEFLQRFASELGLSPSSRSRVASVQPFQPKPWEFGRYQNGSLEAERVERYFD